MEQKNRGCCKSGCGCISDRSQRFTATWFFNFGPTSWFFPNLLCVTALIGLMFLSMGLFFLELESDLNELWVPRDSEDFQHIKEYEGYFGKINRRNAVIITRKSNEDNDNNILTADCIKDAINIWNDVLQLQVTDDGQTYK